MLSNFSHCAGAVRIMITPLFTVSRGILFFQRRHRRVLAESQHQYNHTGLSLPKVSMNPSFHTSSFGNHYNAHNPSASTVSLLPSLSSTYKAPKVPHSTAQVPYSTALVITVSQSMFEG